LNENNILWEKYYLQQNKMGNLIQRPRKNVPKILSKKEEALLLKKQIEIELNRKRFNLLRNPIKIHDETIIHLQKETEQKFIERLGRPITFTEIVDLFHYQKPVNKNHKLVND